MEYKRIERGGPVRVDVARFSAASEECGECQAVFRMEDGACLSYRLQLDALLDAWRSFLKEDAGVPVFVRFFLSDAANQISLLKEKAADLLVSSCCSLIQQPSLDGSKLIIWTYYQKGVECVRLDDFSFLVSRGAYSHIWTGNLTFGEGDSASQTESMLNYYSKFLSNRHLSLLDNCIRTWFFVQNVDVNYEGVVVARRESFERQGLLPSSHYIASTGIEGRSAEADILVRLDAYAVSGLRPSQQQYLYAKSHLNPTYEYGVTFERGVKVRYGDRAHLFISGTASIDNKGNVLYEGDVVRQTERMLENTSVLLEEGGASFGDVSYMFVYLRDMSDYAVVRGMYEERFPDVPKVILLAPVCRPGWLIEMECMAIIPQKESRFPNY